MQARCVLVGDPHGCVEEFKELMKKVQYKQGKDRLIILGDLVDKGPDSLGMLWLAKDIGAEVLRGNHDSKHENYHWEMQAWLSRGSRRIKKPDYLSKIQKELNQSIPEVLWKWMATWPNMIYVTPEIVAVHAGFEPGLPISEQPLNSMWRVRNVDAQGRYKKEYDYEKPVGGYYWSEGWKGPESVVYGHQMFASPNIEHHYDKDGKFVCWTAGIDTACCYGGKLTALVLHDDGTAPELVDVDAKQAYVGTRNDKKGTE